MNRRKFIRSGLLFVPFAPAIVRAIPPQLAAAVNRQPGPAPVTSTRDPHILFEWHCENVDVRLGTPSGYSAGDQIATLVSGAVISNTQFQDGGNSLSIPTASDYANFDWSNSDTLNPNAGTIELWMYCTTVTKGSFLRLYTDASNTIYLYADQANKLITIYHVAGGTNRHGNTNASSFDINAWYHIKGRWDTTAHGGLYLKVTCDLTTGESNSSNDGTTALGTWSGTSGTFYMGDYNGYGTPYYLDNIKIYDNWQ